MKRRSFLKISALTGAATALNSCGSADHQLIRFVPEEDLTPGVATWKPSICTLCPAGCGLLVRVMVGEAEVSRHGQPGIIEMGLAKKLEGNPNHPVNRGKLCARGQAGLQVTYHPDRLRNPLKRSGPRGSGQFQEVSWDDAIKELVGQLSALAAAGQTNSLAFVTKPLRGQRRELIARFLTAFGAPPAISFELFDNAVLRRANALSFGHAALPTFDLARANYVVSFGAEFLGTWNSPVAQAVAYGEMRQGRPGVRGKFVQVEQRVSQTGANADEWMFVPPGTEGVLALGLAHVILHEKLRPAPRSTTATSLIEGWAQGLPDYSPAAVEKRTGVPAGRIGRLAQEMASHGPAVALIGGAPLAQTNGLFSALAVNALNALLESVGIPGGIYFTPSDLGLGSKPLAGTSVQGGESVRSLADQILSGRPRPIKAVLWYDANPVFASPPAWRVRDALNKVPFLASFGSFIDETSALADLMLPDHSFLESWLDDVPESGAVQAVASLAPPAMHPLHNTRAMPEVLLEIARQLGGNVAASLPWQSFEEMLHSAYGGLRGRSGSIVATDADDFWKKMQDQGGWWSAEAKNPAPPASSGARTATRPTEPELRDDEKEFPFYFLPYLSPLLYDGSLAHLPWMQETPDVISTAMWGSWVEINPQTAERLGIQLGDLVEVASHHGKVQAPAVISPGIAPEVIAMPVGQGHEDFTRYASQRGANPVAILAPLTEPETGSLAWAATRVKISRVGKGKLALFAGGMREKPYERR